MKTETVICPPNIQALMTGACMLRKSAHRTILIYTDGTQDTVRNSDIPVDCDWDNWFSIVGSIQKAKGSA